MLFRPRTMIGSNSAVVLLLGFLVPGQAVADAVLLKSLARHEGSAIRISSVEENPNVPAADVALKPIVVIDDDLRYVYVPNNQVTNYVASPPKNVERIKIDQIVAQGGRRVGAVGRILNITDWDDFGRRTLSMEGGPLGRLDVHQGIAEITPYYTRVEGLQAKNGIGWDLRLATSSIPAATLRTVLLRAKGADPKNPDSRLRVVRLFIQAELFREAIGELALIRKDFPELAAGLREQELRLVQQVAQQVLREIELRKAAGQHDWAVARLQSFPDKDVAGETLIKIRDMLKEYDDQKLQYDQALSLFEKHLATVKDAGTKTKLTGLFNELKIDLNIHTLNRMADYLRLADDASMGDDQKLALATSGWLLGPGEAITNLATATTLLEVRDLVVKYLQSSLDSERLDLLDKLKVLEGSSPKSVAKILALLKPPVVTQEANAGVPGLYELKTPGIEEQAEFSYLVQIPPEYHPSRRYPCIVTLNGFDKSEADQIDWWSGSYARDKSMRVGQAWRHGYVVIAPRWQKPLQAEYEYSLREHAAVLFTLRDALQRVSIDTDRVFLSGHFGGGDAAWDIGLAHPDLWAGVVMFSPRADRYVKHYSENQRLVPMYFVAGERDAGSSAEGNWIAENAVELDRYLTTTRTDCTLVVYRGRGRDGFSDEIHRIFEWMNLPGRQRDFAPRSIEVVSMRPWDNFFYWVEVESFPPTSIVLPHAWPVRGSRAAKTEANVNEKTGRISVDPSAEKVTVWLSPAIADFDKSVQVVVNGKEIRGEIKPNLEVMLEDARSRGDRQHPFWSKVEWPERGKR